VSTTEELLDRKVAASVYKTENTAVEIRHAYHVTPFIRKRLAITSPTSGSHSVGVVGSRTQAMEFSFSFRHMFQVTVESCAFKWTCLEMFLFSLIVTRLTAISLNLLAKPKH
jgi:hypothetical protein